MHAATDPQPPPGRIDRWPGEGLSWRWRFLAKPWLKRRLGIPDQQWCRVVADRAVAEFVRRLEYREFRAVEISATSDRWENFGFLSYRNTEYPEYDLCKGPLEEEGFDLVIAEQVLEHVLRPFQAVRNIYRMLRPGGWFVVATPFLIRVHAYPNDCTRWTETGLRHLLIEAGFTDEAIATGSWGNRACVKANFRRFPSWIPWWHSLRNDSLFPVTVWAFARKPL
jgi:SAM-dependent methyltransferase